MYLGNITPCAPLSTVFPQKLKYTCRWLRFHIDFSGFNSDGILSHSQLCHLPFGFLVYLLKSVDIFREGLLQLNQLIFEIISGKLCCLLLIVII